MGGFAVACRCDVWRLDLGGLGRVNGCWVDLFNLIRTNVPSLLHNIKTAPAFRPPPTPSPHPQPHPFPARSSHHSDHPQPSPPPPRPSPPRPLLHPLMALTLSPNPVPRPRTHPRSVVGTRRATGSTPSPPAKMRKGILDLGLISTILPRVLSAITAVLFLAFVFISR